MPLYIASLNSGSNGNCYYVGNEQDAVLIDAGISCRDVEKRMAKLGLPMERVRGIFVSHEHADHISGLVALMKKHKLLAYFSTGTLNNLNLPIPAYLVRCFGSHGGYFEEMGSLNITPFIKQHDAAEPYSFVVESNGIKVGVMTDIGVVCKQVVHYFRQCHAVFLESNYDEHMLKTGGYPKRLQKRICGGQGHLSNSEALELFEANRSPFLTHLLLSHLSQNNNRPELVLDLYRAYQNELTIVVASRDCESAVYKIEQNNSIADLSKTVIPFETKQYSLF